MMNENVKARLPEGADIWAPMKDALTKMVHQLSIGARRNVAVNHLNASLEVTETLTLVYDPEAGYFAELKLTNSPNPSGPKNLDDLITFGWEVPNDSFPNYSRRFATDATPAGIVSSIVLSLTSAVGLNKASWFSIGQTQSDIALGDASGLWKHKSAPWIRKLPPSKL
jgi:hypothetical protein